MLLTITLLFFNQRGVKHFHSLEISILNNSAFYMACETSLTAASFFVFEHMVSGTWGRQVKDLRGG